MEADTALRMCSGFQPVCATVATACAPAFGVVMSRNTSAPEPASFFTCGATVGSVGSYVSCATTVMPEPSIPAVNPPSRSLPKPSFCSSTATLAFGRFFFRYSA